MKLTHSPSSSAFVSLISPPPSLSFQFSLPNHLTHRSPFSPTSLHILPSPFHPEFHPPTSPFHPPSPISVLTMASLSPFCRA